MAYNYARTLYATPPEPAPARLTWISEAYDHFRWNWQVWISALVVAGAIGVVVLTIWFLIAGLPWLESFLSSAMALGPTGGTPSATWMTKYMLTPAYFVLAYGGMAIGYTLLALFNGGYFAISNNCLRGKPSVLADFFAGMKYFPGMLLVTFIIAFPGIIGSVAQGLRYASMVSSGTLTSTYPTSLAGSMTSMAESWGLSLLISLAYVIMAVLFAPAMALIADGVGVRESIGRSAKLMSGTFWPALGIGILFSLVYYATGCMTCMIATTITIPMLYLMCSIAARERLGLVVTGYVPPAFAPPPADLSGVWPPPPNPSEQPPAGWGAVYADPKFQRPANPPPAPPGEPPQDAPPPEPPRF